MTDFLTPPNAPAFFSPAMALWNQREQLLRSHERLKALKQVVNDNVCLHPYQWAQWFSVALEFQPDLILELGRAWGNSTCVFTEAAGLLENCRVLSLCLSNGWEERTRPRVAEVVPPEWFTPLEARRANLLASDPAELVGNAQRVLVVWDAHGYEIAEFVLGALMPVLQDRAHLVLMHDISDTRYAASSNDYDDKGLWRGNNDGYTRLRLGYMDSAVEQAVAMVDFTSRNGLELHSSDHSFHTELSDAQAAELQESLGDWFLLIGHWFWFSLQEHNTDSPIFFPTFTALPEYQSEQDFEPLGPLSATPQNIRPLQEQIRAMQHSPFWKLRGLTMKMLGWPR